MRAAQDVRRRAGAHLADAAAGGHPLSRARESLGAGRFDEDARIRAVHLAADERLVGDVTFRQQQFGEESTSSGGGLTLTTNSYHLSYS